MGLLISCLMFACSYDALPTDKTFVAMCKEVKNNKLHWTGDIVGLTPVTTAGFDAAIEAGGDKCNPILVRMLDDPRRFAAAHVALSTLATDVPPRTTTRWDGLYVLLKADGSVVYSSPDIAVLKRRWKAWLSAKNNEPR